MDSAKYVLIYKQ